MGGGYGSTASTAGVNWNIPAPATGSATTSGRLHHLLRDAVGPVEPGQDLAGPGMRYRRVSPSHAGGDLRLQPVQAQVLEKADVPLRQAGELRAQHQLSRR